MFPHTVSHTTKEFPLTRLIVLAAALFSLVTGCAGQYRDVARAAPEQTRMPADEPAYLVSVTLPDLRPPSEIREDCSTYVAWVTDETGNTRRAGVVDYDPRTRAGKVSMLSSTDRLTLMVTAEPDPNALAPSRDALVVRQRVGTASATSDDAARPRM